MNERFEAYVKPAVLRLEFEADVNVSMGTNCKTSTSPNVGSSPCRVPAGSGGSCNTVGS